MREPRAGRPDELRGLVGLADAFYLEDGFATPLEHLRTNLAALLADDAARVAVIDDAAGRLLAFAITTTSFGLEDGAIAELEDLYVLPEVRDRGLGRALVADAARWARQRGCAQLEIVVVGGDRHAQLINYYRDQGFGDPRILLRKPLR